MAMYHSIKQIFTSHGIPNGEAQALSFALIEDVVGLSRTEALMSDAEPDERLLALADRIATGEPLQYVTGIATFHGLTLHVEPGVLIPRPETEELVDWIISDVPAPESILDIGTGSGCIALALKDHFADAEVCAWDVSDDALRIARGNADSLGIKVKFNKVDVLQDIVSSRENCYDIIVSNPPYICHSEMDEMETNVLDHEPHLALFVPNDDPLLFYREIASKALTLLATGGHLFFEINRQFGNEIMEMLRGMNYTNVELRKDQFENDRMVHAIKPCVLR